MFPSAAAVLAAVILAAVVWKTGKSRGMHGKWWMLLLFCAFLGGWIRMHAAWERWNQIEATCPQNQEWICLEGKVAEIREKEQYTAVKLRTEVLGTVLVYVEKEEENEDSKTGALESGRRSGEQNERSGEQKMLDTEELRIGMWIEAEGEISCFDEAGNPGQFDLKAYYRSQGISAALFADRIRSSARQGKAGEYSPYLNGLYRFRRRCSGILEEICQLSDSGVFRAAILGEKEGMDSALRDLYQKNGISHLLAISSLHLSMIGMGIYQLLRRLGLRFGLSGLLSGAIIISYGLMTGGSGSAMRAVIMLLTSFLAAWLGRTYDLLSALSLAAILLAGRNPFLVGQSGFQLSFGAVLGIGLLGNPLTAWLKAEKVWQKNLVISLSVQLFTCPIVMWHYFQYPVYGILLNLLVVPLMGYVVGSGLAGISAGFLLPALGMAAVGSGHYILQGYEQLCLLFSRLPGGQAVFGRPMWGQMVLYYLLLAVMMAWMQTDVRLSGISSLNNAENRRKCGENRKEKDKKWSKSGVIIHIWSGFRGKRYLMAAAGTLCCFFSLAPIPQHGCDVAFLDVGQGDGIVIQCEGGVIEMEGLERVAAERNPDIRGEASVLKSLRQAVILVDGGSTSEKKLGENRLEPYLKSEGITCIQIAVVSHGDTDHISGLRYLLEECEEIQIQNLILPELGRGDGGYDLLIAAANDRGTKIWYMDAGDWIQAGECRLVCLYPDKEDEIDRSDRNQQSLIIRADYGKFHMLLTGDADAEGETRMTERMESASERMTEYMESASETLSDIQVLKASHHGSRFSNCERLLEAVRPALTVISYEEGNSYGHPHPEALERIGQSGSRILKTGEQGAVLLHVEGDRMRYRTYR